jgi:sugar phosphate isomerase/epimerase
MVDFDAYFGACKQSGINGPVSLHIEYDIFSGPEEEFSKKEKYQIAGQVLKQELDFLLRHMKTAGLYQP